MKLFTKLWTTLLLLCVAGVANATGYVIDQRFSSVADIGEQLFVIANESEGMAIYNKDAQNLAYGTYAEAMAGTSHLWKLHSLADEADPEIQSCYTLEAVTADGSSIGLWGNPAIYLNSGAEGGFNGCFVLGLKKDGQDVYGQDVQYGAVWEVEFVQGKGFALKNKARGGYFAGTAPAPTGEDPIYWTFCTLKEGGEEPPIGIQTIFDQDFTLSQGDFTIDDVTLGEGLTYVWKQDAKFGMKASAYANKTNNVSESWLISPEISLETMAKTDLTFSHAISKFFGDVTTEATVWVREVGGEWKQFEISYPEVPEGKSYSDFEDVTIDLNEYNGKTIQVGFKYTSTSDAAGTWEIKSLKIEGVMGNPEPEPERVLEDGKYYIANMAAAMSLAPAFLGAGNSWGTQASLVKHPEYAVLSMLPDGTYSLESQVSNGGEKYFLGENGYMDSNPAMPLTLTKVRSEFKKDNGEPLDLFTITSGEKIFGWDGETTVLASNLTADSEKALWIIASEEEAIEGLASATASDPMDATFLFLDPGFGRNNRYKSAWQGDDFSVGGDNTNMNAEKWGGNSQTFDIHQTAEVPNGVYQISWNGFYRYNNTTDNTNDIAVAAHADGTEVINSFIYINDTDYPLTSIADEEATAALAAVEKNIPFSQAEASAAFGMGLYAQSATVTVTDGKLTIGIKKTEHPGTDWTVWDNFEIYYLGAPASHTWDFTKWSDATITNLKAEAAKVTVTADPDKEGNTMCTDNGALWSDHEKAEGKTCDTYAASKDNCFWYIGGAAEPAANGVAIAELKGLEFNTTYGASRALAIAVNYPSTSLGTYHGPSYLWFGGKNQEILTIKSVKGGSIIKIGVESHKESDARGVQLFVGETQLTDPEGNAVAVPKTYTEQTWQVPAGDAVDVIVKNTNGCHIYFIDATIADEELAAAPEGWHSVISNGNLAGEENVNFYTKENGGAPILGTIVDGAGKNGTRGLIVNTPDNPGTDWDAQFFIKADETIPAGYKIHVEFDYMATQEAQFDTQCHAEPGDYIHWYCVESWTAKPEWQHMSKEVEVSAATQDDKGNWNGEWGKACTNEANGKPFQTIAFNLSKIKTATTFHFDNIIFWVSDFDTSVKEIKAADADKQGIIYDLRGQKVNGALQKGIYIQNGKKFVVK